MSRIRSARTDDAAALAELTTQLGYPVDPVRMALRMAALLDRPDEAVLVATGERGRPIGWVHVARVAVLEADARASINGLVVDEAHRSGGLGAQLLAAAEAWARGHGLDTMLVRSRSTRERAHRFYERHGYVETKRSHVFEKRLV